MTTKAVAKKTENEAEWDLLRERIDQAGELLRQKSATEQAYNRTRADIQALMTKLEVEPGDAVAALSFEACIEQQQTRSIDAEALRKRVDAETFYSVCDVSVTKAEKVLDGKTFERVVEVGTRPVLRIKERRADF